MILKCKCFNSTADALHGDGFRPHSALVKFADRPERTAIEKAGQDSLLYASQRWDDIEKFLNE